MCSFQTLFQDDHIGYVVHCRECKKIQLGFGNLMLTINANEFESFHNFLKGLLSEQREAQYHTARCIFIPTPCEGLRLLLSRRELQSFDRMMEEADTELKSSCLIGMFSQVS